MATLKIIQDGVKTITNEMAGKLVLPNETGNTGVQAFQYPLSMSGDEDRHSNFLVMYAVDPMSGGLSNSDINRRSLNSVSGKFKETTLAVVQMYMPAINENLSHEYSDNDGGFLQDLMMNYKGTMDPTLENGALLGAAALQTGITQMSANVGKAAQQYNAQISGQIMGSRSANMYKNTSIRSQMLMFQLRPKNMAELREVGNILRTFLIYSSASNQGAPSANALISKVVPGAGLGKFGEGADGSAFTVLKVPPLWYIEERINSRVSKENRRFTPKFAMGPCAISNVRITKTPEQIYESFSETAGDPIAIDLELTFTELRPVFREYWEALTSNLGGTDSGQFFFGSYGDQK